MAKRLMDLVGAGLGLLVAAIPMAVIAFVIRITMGPPVLFRQVRPGLHAQPFELVKFRTMRSGDGPDARAPHPPRDASCARTSLDELPELWNILKGEMSLVGPRPLLMEYLDRYSPRQARRHEVRPGLTGLAQVEGRNLVDWDERLELDVRYVETRSLALDLRIIGRTVGAGAPPRGHQR